VLQVRELAAGAGLEVTALKRMRVGGFRLPRDMGLGQVRCLRVNHDISHVLTGSKHLFSHGNVV
jgi:16S rRNA U516 pseudouridylate synthase RsuA-like enzyme